MISKPRQKIVGVFLFCGGEQWKYMVLVWEH